jgi:hypothetical protein
MDGISEIDPVRSLRVSCRVMLATSYCHPESAQP